MKTLLDTNILLRSSQPASPDHSNALAAVARLLAAKRQLCISSQTIYEFLAVATRPVAENGLGMNHALADAQLTTLLAGFDVLFDSPAVAAKTRELVTTLGVTGKKIHDARIAGAMLVYGVQEILTFNVQDFVRYPGIIVLRPGEVARGMLPAAIGGSN